MARVALTTGDDPIIHVVLSERNLLALLTKLYQDDSFRTLTHNDVTVDGELSYGGTLVLVAEPDDVHYSSPTRHGAPAGEMHPTTARIISVLKERLAAERLEACAHEVLEEHRCPYDDSTLCTCCEVCQGYCAAETDGYG